MHMSDLLKKNFRPGCQTGAALVETALIVALIAMVAFLGVKKTGRGTKCTFYATSAATNMVKIGDTFSYTIETCGLSTADPQKLVSMVENLCNSSLPEALSCFP